VKIHQQKWVSGQWSVVSGAKIRVLCDVNCPKWLENSPRGSNPEGKAGRLTYDRRRTGVTGKSNKKKATNTEGLGLVATPGQEADTGQGLGWKYSLTS
jgi:hypothetical protein